jgi:membrane-bound acyltransferase YfiQ involved in biofilm formation
MSALDLFAWVVLLILVVSTVAMFFIAGSLPGHVAKSRNHPWAQAVQVAGWVTLICGFVLWPIALIWAFVDVPARGAPQAAAPR